MARPITDTLHELIRADRVHEAAAKELIEKIRTGLPEGVPLLMGTTAKSCAA